MSKFNSKSFNPQAFGNYVNRIPNTKKSELAKSKAVGKNEQASNALSTQTGALYAKVPYFGTISSETSQNNDGSTDITSTSTTTFEQGFITASRMDSWTERSFSTSITAGVDFMDNAAKQISDYKLEVTQNILLAMLKGIFSMTGEMNQAFIEKHTYDVTAIDDGCVNQTSLNKTIQKAGGDNKNIFKLVIMHSEVATNLENINLLKHLTYTDADGVSRDLTMATWNGRLVLIDDNMPVEIVGATADTTTYKLTTDKALNASKTYYTKSGSNYTAVAKNSEDVENIATYYEKTVTAGKDGKTVYTSYVLGENSIVLDNIGDEHEFEMSRNPAKNGGEDTLYVRNRYICGATGISFEKPASITASASNTDLANGANWCVINDGTTAIEHKAIPICRIISLG